MYKTVLLSLDGGLVTSSDGIQVMSDRSLSSAPQMDTIFVIRPNPLPRRGLSAVTLWLKRLLVRASLWRVWTRALT